MPLNLIIDHDLTLYDDTEIEYRWRNPRGHIKITTGNGQCNIELQCNDADAQEPPIHKCPYQQMEDMPDDFITNGHLIILTNEDGNYFDAINIPVGWMLCVNDTSRTLQLSHYLQLG
jgi:hypothetical protein